MEQYSGMITAALITMFSGFLMFVFKEIPKNIFFRISQFISNSISVISINDEDYIFLNEWLNNLDLKLLKKHIELKQLYTLNGDEHIPSIGYGNYLCRKGFFTFININKNKISNNLYTADEIRVTMFGIGANKIYKDFNTKLDNKNKNVLKVFTSNPYYYIKEPLKSFDTIFNDNINVIKNHLDIWKKNKKYYIKSGDAYKTGILLYGPPGTGKSTIARAIATYLNYNLHVILMSDYQDVTKLSERITKISQRSVVLFDDVDTMIKSREEIDSMDGKEKKEYYCYIQTVMNILDGAISPNEVVFVACTNYIDKLDSAFKRKSRFDLQLKIDMINYNNAKNMCNYYGINENVLDKYNIVFPCTPADIKSLIFSNL